MYCILAAITMRIITYDDIIDTYQKIAQRGLGFILSKIKVSELDRTKSAFSDSAFSSSNWWIIPKVNERWNKLITGDENQIYEHYVLQKHLTSKKDLTMLSIGAGMCSHELEFAKSPKFKEITCLDIANNLLIKAAEKAKQRGLSNLSFRCEDIRQSKFAIDAFDIVFFHASLHHFNNIEELIKTKVIPWIKPNGIVIINEYVGPDRLQFSKQQIKVINQGLNLLPIHLKKRFKTRLVKRKFSGSGYIRMVIADPSECIQSSQILPVLRNYLTVIEEKPYGGNLLMNVLKDISHNFINLSKKDEQYLQDLFQLEDEYLREHESDFVFAIYQNSKLSN